MKKSTLTHTATAVKGISFVAFMAAWIALLAGSSAASLSLTQTVLAWLALPVSLGILNACIETASMVFGWKDEAEGAA